MRLQNLSSQGGCEGSNNWLSRQRRCSIPSSAFLPGFSQKILVDEQPGLTVYCRVSYLIPVSSLMMQQFDKTRQAAHIVTSWIFFGHYWSFSQVHLCLWPFREQERHSKMGGWNYWMSYYVYENPEMKHDWTVWIPRIRFHFILLLK